LLTGLITSIALPLELLSRPVVRLPPRLLSHIALCHCRFRGLHHWRLDGTCLVFPWRLGLTGLFILLLRILIAEGPSELLLLRHVLLIVGLSGGQYAQIVLGVLIIAFSHYRIPGRLRVTRKLHVFFGNGLSSAADLHVRPIALIDAVDWIAALPPASAGSAATSAATRPFVMVMIMLALSHDLCISRLLPFEHNASRLQAATGGSTCTPSPKPPEQTSHWFRRMVLALPSRAFTEANTLRLKCPSKPARLLY
jgi:hypothetical protein